MGLRELERLGWQGVPQVIRAAAICHSLKIFITKKKKFLLPIVTQWYIPTRYKPKLFEIKQYTWTNTVIFYVEKLDPVDTQRLKCITYNNTILTCPHLPIFLLATSLQSQHPTPKHRAPV